MPDLSEYGPIQEPFFRSAIRRVLDEYLSHYGERLAAVYVFGSIHRDEALPGISDLDAVVALRDAYNRSDKIWRKETEARLKQEIPGFPGLPRGESIDGFFGGLREEADESARFRSLSWLYRVRYDSTRVWGPDITAGFEAPPPDHEWAKTSFQSVRRLVRHTAGLAPRTDGDWDLTDEPSQRLRKLARLAVLGGAFLQIAGGGFRSFKVMDVLPPLHERYPERRSFLEDTGRWAIPLPLADESKTNDYLHDLLVWLEWVHERLNESR